MVARAHSLPVRLCQYVVEMALDIWVVLLRVHLIIGVPLDTKIATNQNQLVVEDRQSTQEASWAEPPNPLYWIEKYNINSSWQ